MIDKIDENGELMVVLAEQLGLLVPRQFDLPLDGLHRASGPPASAAEASGADRQQ
jgi:hypothetical protein